MAIKSEERQITTQPSGRLIREFRTQLPTPDMSGLNYLGSVLGNIAEQEIIKKEQAENYDIRQAQQEAKLAARERKAEEKADARERKAEARIEARTQEERDIEQAKLDIQARPVIKYADGTISRAVPPPGGSDAYRRAFDAASDSAYLRERFNNGEYQLNIIMSDRTLDADSRIKKAQAFVAGAVAGADVRVRGTLGELLNREINQRQGAALNLEAANNVASLITQNAQASDDYLKKYIDYFSVGSQDNAAIALTGARGAFESAVRLRNPNPQYVEQELQNFDKRVKELETFSPTLDRIRNGISNKTVAPDEIERFISMLRPGASPKGSVAFDMTDTDVAGSMSEGTRNHIRGIMETLSRNYSAELTQSAEERKADEVNLDFASGATSLNSTVSANVHTRAAQKALQNIGLDPHTPQGVIALARLHNGVLPEDMYRDRFKDIHTVDPSNPNGLALIQDRLRLYQQLKSIPSPVGFIDRTNILSPTERNFLWHIDNNRAAGDNLLLAADTAKALIQKNIGKSREEQLKFIRSDQTVKATTDLEVVDAAAKFFQRGQTGGSFFLPTSKELPSQAIDFIVNRVATDMVQSIPYEQALKNAGRDFTSNWTKSSIIISGSTGGTNNPWVRKTDQVPLAFDAINGSQTDEYLKPFMDKYIKEAIDLDQAKGLGVPVDRLQWGGNIRLRPKTNIGPDRAYEVVYYEPNAAGVIPLRTKDGQSAIIVPNGARQVYERASASENTRRTLETREIRQMPSPPEENVPGTFSGMNVILETPSMPPFEVDLKVLQQPASLSSLLTTTRASVPPSTQRYVDFTVSRLQQYQMEEKASYFIKTLGLESRFNALAQNPKSTAFGLGQMLDSTWAQYGRGRREDPEAQIDAVIRFTKDNFNSFRSANGREPSNGELYLMHQQGFAGATALLSNPNSNAMSILERVTGSRATAVASIANNLPANQARFAGRMTAREFTTFWMGKFD